MRREVSRDHRAIDRAVVTRVRTASLRLPLVTLLVGSEERRVVRIGQLLYSLAEEILSCFENLSLRQMLELSELFLLIICRFHLL